MPPLVSVLLPVRNAAHTLRAALASLRAQTMKPGAFEIVAIDDGSEDDSLAILEADAKSHGQMTLLRGAKRGLVGALQSGIEAARGSLIARMDADDSCDPARLQLQSDYLAAHPETGVVSCRVKFGGTGAGYARHVAWSNSLLTHEDISLARFRESPVAHPSVMFRRDVLARHGGYHKGNFPEDYECWLRWLDAGVRFEKLSEVLLTWNDSPARLSRTDPRYDVERFYEVKCRYLARWLSRHNPHHPKIIVIGAGRITRRRVDFLRREGIAIEAWADIDREKVGKVYDGAPVIHHDEIPRGRFVIPFVGNVGAAEYLREMLEARGFVRGSDFIEAV